MRSAGAITTTTGGARRADVLVFRHLEQRAHYQWTQQGGRLLTFNKGRGLCLR